MDEVEFRLIEIRGIVENIETQSELFFSPFNILKPKVFLDGDSWCALYGDNLQEGICGFGRTPYQAAIDFNKSFYTDKRSK